MHLGIYFSYFEYFLLVFNIFYQLKNLSNSDTCNRLRKVTMI